MLLLLALDFLGARNREAILSPIRDGTRSTTAFGLGSPSRHLQCLAELLMLRGTRPALLGVLKCRRRRAFPRASDLTHPPLERVER